MQYGLKQRDIMFTTQILIMKAALFAAMITSLAAMEHPSIRLLTTSEPSSSVSAIIFALIIFSLLACIYYDSRNGYRWINSIRHLIGEYIHRIRTYRRGKSQKQQRIETEEVLPTPKTTHINEIDNQRPFIEPQVNLIREQVLISPKSDPIAQQELEESSHEVDMKNVFQARESKHKSKKEKKPKSKLKQRLQSQNFEEGEEKQDGEDQTSFNDQNSLENNSFGDGGTRGTEVQ